MKVILIYWVYYYFLFVFLLSKIVRSSLPCFENLCYQYIGLFDPVKEIVSLTIPKYEYDDKICITMSSINHYQCNPNSVTKIYVPISLNINTNEDFLLYGTISTSKIFLQNISYYIVTNLSFNDEILAFSWKGYGTIMIDTFYLDFPIENVNHSSCISELQINDYQYPPTPTKSLLNQYIYQKVEFGSYFIKMKTICSEISQKIFHSFGYIEYISSTKSILQGRQSVDSSDNSYEITNHLLVNNLEIEEEISIERTIICIMGPNNMDGQKKIWLQQLNHMNQSKFFFKWILMRKSIGISTEIESILRNISYIEIIENPYDSYDLYEDHLNEKPNDNTISAFDYWENGNYNKLHEYIIKRFNIANKQIHFISPNWVREIYQLQYDLWIDLSCDVIVYRNNREFSMDSLMIDTAKLLYIPIIVELQSLYPNNLTIPDIIIGPSHYAIAHESILNLLETAKQSNQTIPQRFIISPGIDFNQYNSIPFHTQKPHSNQIIIGFLGRLASEKNCGLFLLTAKLLLQKHSNIEFIVIGDGPLLSNLKELAKRLEIDSFVEFTGWIWNELHTKLLTIDIFINLSLRADSETFCIANIETMSLGIPLITFAIGGNRPNQVFIHF